MATTRKESLGETGVAVRLPPTPKKKKGGSGSSASDEGPSLNLRTARTPLVAGEGPSAKLTKGKRSVVVAPTYERIAARAYEIFMRRGGMDGHDREDWEQAERELASLP